MLETELHTLQVCVCVTVCLSLCLCACASECRETLRGCTALALCCTGSSPCSPRVSALPGVFLPLSIILTCDFPGPFFLLPGGAWRARTGAMALVREETLRNAELLSSAAKTRSVSARVYTLCPGGQESSLLVPGSVPLPTCFCIRIHGRAHGPQAERSRVLVLPLPC